MNRKLISIILLLILLVPGSSISKVFMKRDEALKTAFPDADTIEKKDVFLTEVQTGEIEALAQSKLDSRLYIIYVGKRGDETLGYAIIDTHTLRTKTETVMFVINPDGSLRQAEILAFFEPPEYMAGSNWISLYYGKDADDSLKLGKDIPNITGATITSNSLAQAMRRMLSIIMVTQLENKTVDKEERK